MSNVIQLPVRTRTNPVQAAPVRANYYLVEGTYYTPQGYHELCLQMSTAEYHTHEAVPVESLPFHVLDSDVVDLYIVRDWAGNLVFGHETIFGTFDDAWEFMIMNVVVPDPEDENAYDDFVIVPYERN